MRQKELRGSQKCGRTNEIPAQKFTPSSLSNENEFGIILKILHNFVKNYLSDSECDELKKIDLFIMKKTKMVKKMGHT